ncbi:MAG: DMT family transporter [Deltaproteobacteria bacterium]|nr:MAG: DMT family transporter [Deltaproteobacteria bacterium]
MIPEIVAMFSAMGWAGDSVLVRLGVRRSNIFAAMLMSYLVSVTCIWTYLVATTPLVFLRSRAMVYFLISGCLQPLFARALFYEGITRIGVARAGPLRGAEPLFATIIAVVLLHERPGIMVYLGTALIMGSLWLISGSRGGAAKWRLVDAALPLGAGLVSAISQTLRKEGLKILPNPFVATAIVTSTSLALLISFILLTKRVNLLRMPRQSFLFFVAAGCVAVSAQVTNFIAIGQGDLSVIIPLLNTTPLFTVLFSGLFLRSLETLSPRIVVGASLMVGGVVLITLR